MKPNNVTRLLDSRKIPYTAFELPAEKLGAVEVALLLDVPPEQVFKTIVVAREGKGKPILALTPGPAEVDLKALAKAVGEKKLVLPSEREAERLTGLQVGGISPLALLDRRWPIIIDETIILFDRIEISAGKVGVGVIVEVEGLLRVLQARQADIIS